VEGNLERAAGRVHHGKGGDDLAELNRSRNRRRWRGGSPPAGGSGEEEKRARPEAQGQDLAADEPARPGVSPSPAA
jgi:hypothetical protein